MEDIKVHSSVSFGGYKWLVLDIQNNTALIITEDIIEQRAYHDAYKDITWADCALRKYLNGEFYDKFNEIDKSRIIPVINKNPDNQWYGSKGGADTQDSIFLLSIEEVVCNISVTVVQNCITQVKNKDIGLKEKMRTTVSE